MNVGFVLDHYADEVVTFAGACGFDIMEIMVDYNHNLDLDKLTDGDTARLVSHFEKNGMRVGSVCCSLNLLDGDLENRRCNIEYMTRMIRRVRSFGTNLITTNVWGNKKLTPEENIPLFGEVYAPVARLCEQEDVYIAFENCPHFVGYPAPIGNIGYSPEMWRALFEAVPSDHLGLEFDPSHLYWLGIDYLWALREFAGKVLAFHAKDTEIRPELRNQYGILGKQIGKRSEWDAGWWRYRIPGWGEIDWKAIYKTFYDIGFDGPVFIEHEDPVFDGNLRAQGLKMGLTHLRSLEIPS